MVHAPRAALLLVLLLAGCQSTPEPTSPLPEGAEARSLLGEVLYPMPLPDEVRARYEENLIEATRVYAADPTSEETIIWLGRRTAYLGRYREAIAIFSGGLDRHPFSHKLLRHRGHRYLTVREIDAARRDLRRAARLAEQVDDEIEADGLPNRLGIPTSSSHTNIYYHLGLAQYVQRDFAAAAESYQRCLDYATNDDMRVAALYWLYLSLQRAGQAAEAVAAIADVTPDIEIIENTSYHRLLLLFRGLMSEADVAGGPREGVSGAAVDDATLAYGLAIWHLLEGRADEAHERFTLIVDGAAWPAFGHLAAEAELAAGH